MSGWIAKIARFAASKAGAFFYAVAVGVAGNLAFHFVQPHDPAPAAVSAMPIVAPSNARPPADKPAPAPAVPAIAAAPILPAPPAPAALPSPNSLPLPALKPAALPPVPPSEAALRPAPAPAPAPVASDEAAEPSPPRPAAPVLQPLSPAIEVATPPMPPALPARIAAPATAAAAKDPPGGLAVSDIWHPGRAIQKSLHWAGRQVPLIGDADSEPRPAAAHAATAGAPAAAPISLLPEAASLYKDDAAAPPRKPGAPGPGSGGLY